jgi:hypothetical protein
MKHLPSRLLMMALAGAAGLCITAFLIFTLSDEIAPTEQNYPHSSLILLEEARSPANAANPWLWSAGAAAAVFLMFLHFRRTTRKSFAGNGSIAETRGVSHRQIQAQAADQLRDALAVFNRKVLHQSDSSDELAPLYKAFVSARNEAERRNCRFMYDAVGASHVQAIERMLTEMEDDLRREWPEILRVLERVADSPSETDLASFRAEVGTGAAYEVVLAYLHLLRQDVQKELLHAELRYRHLLG